MSEARDTAEHLIARHGRPALADHDAALHWLRTVWPDVADWLGAQMRANVAEHILYLSRNAS
jgi:hypothetical protein